MLAFPSMHRTELLLRFWFNKRNDCLSVDKMFNNGKDFKCYGAQQQIVFAG